MPRYEKTDQTNSAWADSHRRRSSLFGPVHVHHRYPRHIAATIDADHGAGRGRLRNRALRGARHGCGRSPRRRSKPESAFPLIADIHFDYKLALKVLERGIDGLRLNPGNIGERWKVAEVVKAAAERQVPIRIGVNAGSLEKELLEKYGHPTAEAMVESALGHVRILEDLGYDQIKISLKASDVMKTVEAYRLLSAAVDYPLHIGITEAGTIFSGTIKSVGRSRHPAGRRYRRYPAGLPDRRSGG